MLNVSFILMYVLITCKSVVFVIRLFLCTNKTLLWIMSNWLYLCSAKT